MNSINYTNIENNSNFITESLTKDIFQNSFIENLNKKIKKKTKIIRTLNSFLLVQ